MEDLYLKIFDVSETPIIPVNPGFSYGILFVEGGEPVRCMVVNDQFDKRLRMLLEHGMIHIEAISFGRGDPGEMYYGYLTEEMLFYCEEKIFPKGDENFSELNEGDGETDDTE